MAAALAVVLPVPLSDPVALALAPGDKLDVGVPEKVGESVAVDDGEGALEPVGVGVPLLEPVGETVALPVGEFVGVMDEETVELSDGVDDDEPMPD